MNPELGKQPAGDEGSDDANDYVANQTEARTLHDLAREPACNST